MDKDLSTETLELRRRAEEQLRATGEIESSEKISDSLRMLHELQVHQIELEMLNEELRQARDNVEVSLASFTELYDFAPVGYFTLDRLGNILQSNLTGSSLLGLERSRLLNKRFGLFVLPESRPVFVSFLGRVFENQIKQSCEVHLLTGADTRIDVYIDAAVPKDGKKCNVVVLDITERKQMEENLSQAKADIEEMNKQLETALTQAHQLAEKAIQAKEETDEKVVELGYQASHDTLTGLPNRHCFEQHLSEYITRSSGTKAKSLALLYLDLDTFKQINDTLGHKIGDLLLTEVAVRLQSCLRSDDMLARMGGDEFTVILPHCNSRSVAQLVASRMIDCIKQPYEIQGHRIVVEVSIGLAAYPSDGNDAVTLLKHADAAMYKAKQSGRGTFCWYSKDVDIKNQQRADLEMDIRDALEKKEFSVHYQPIIRLVDDSIFAGEALLRWEHPGNGIILPNQIIPIAEEIGLISQIGDFVLRTACARKVAWHYEGVHLTQISVNVSIAQICDAGWFDSVRVALMDTGIDAQCLDLELTETDFAVDYKSIWETLRKVQDLGVNVSIDDFGMGRSSLSRLKDFPVIHLKIDGSFVKDIENDQNSHAMMRSIIEMAHGQGIRVTAEWVETESQMDMLRSIGCDYAQGYFISPALPAEAFGNFVKEWNTK